MHFRKGKQFNKHVPIDWKLKLRLLLWQAVAQLHPPSSTPIPSSPQQVLQQQVQHSYHAARTLSCRHILLWSIDIKMR